MSDTTRHFLLRKGFAIANGQDLHVMAVAIESVAAIVAVQSAKRVTLYSSTGTHLVSYDWPEHVTSEDDAVRWLVDEVLPSW